MLSGFTNRYNSIGDAGGIMGGIMAAKDEDEFRMKGVTDGPTLEQRQIEAAQKYANLVTSFPTTAQEIADVQAAKAKLVELNVSREQIEAQGIDASQGISGVMGPSVSGVLDAVGQGAIDLIGAGGQAFSDIISLGQGAEVAQTLLDPISILTGGFGGTINWGDSGKTTPLILGNTTATGMPVGLGIPDPRTIAEEGLFPWLINNAGLGGLTTTAAVAGGNALDTTKKTGDGVGLSGASLIAAAEALDKNNDAVKTITGAEDIVAGGVSSDSPVIKTGARDIIAGSVDSDIPAIKTGARDIIAGSVDSDIPAIKTGPMSDADLDEILTDIGGRPAVDGGYDTPVIKTSSPAIKTGGDTGGDTGGSGGTPQQSGVRTVSGGPGPLVDIDYLYDFEDSLLQPFRVTDDEDEIEGRRVKRFSGADDSYVLADGASYGPTNTGVRGKLSQFVGDNAGALLTSAVGGLFGLLDNDEQQPAGYQGAIPDYTAQRNLLPGAFDQTGRRPGSMGRRYFTDVQYVPTGEGAVMQGVGLPAIAPAADTATELDTEGLAVVAPVATLTDTLGQEGVSNLISNITGMFGGGAGATTDLTGGATTDLTGGATTDLTGGATTTTDDSNAAFNSFIAPFSNQEQLTSAQLIQLGDSGYDLSTIASTLKVDPTALSNAIAKAKSAAQVESIFSAINPLDISKDDAKSVADLILGGQTDIENVSKRFDNISDMDVIEGMLRGGYESPAAMTERLAATTPDLTEVQLMASLLSQGRTTPEELAAYYGNNPDYPEYAGVTAGDVRGLAKKLGIEGYAQGGDINGYYLGGATDGMADQIPATIDNMQPAALSDGEFVIPADVVSHLGNGNSDAGAKNLYSMMDRVRTDRTGNPNQGRQIDPNKYLA
jgi:hypothetical protein